MDIKNYKKTKQQQVFEILDKQGHILDDETAKIFGNDKIYRVSEYIRIWVRLQADREYFKDKKIVEKSKGHRCHLIKLDGEQHYYKVGKEYWNEIIL